ncbi:MAG: zinc ribbon domain-containing protein, partial [Lachnospiraceae bacterium]|nr:zinc ribbon domain-containing protein [Lachnospiraceae bacterium]
MGAGEMKYCRNCGQQISRNAKFCKFCGYQFEVQQEPAAPAMKYCGSCGKENAADAAFCRYCGQPIQQDAAAQQRPAAASAGRTAQQRPAAASSGRPMQQTAPGQGQPPVRKKWLIPVVIVISAMVIFSGVIYFMIARGVIQELSGKPGNTGETAQSVQSGESVPGQESAAQAGDIWELTDEQKAEMAEIGEMPDLDPEDYIEKEPAEPLSAHGYDWLYPEGEDWEFPEEEENTSESASVDEVPQDPLQDHPSPAFSTSPVKGITISGAEGALDKERTFTMTEVPDEQYQALNDRLEEIDNMSAVLGAWELDAGLADDEVLPGCFTMDFDLAELEIDEDLYDSLCVYRVDDAGNWYPYVSQLDGKNLRITSSQNSVIVIGALVLLPFLPDIGTTIQGIASGAVYDPRAKSFYVEVDGKRTFQILASLETVAGRMEQTSAQQLEEAREKAKVEAQRQYRESLGYTEEQKDWLEYTGKAYYRIYLKCLKAQLAQNSVRQEYEKQLKDLQNSGALLQALSPVIMVINNSKEAYKYLRDHTGAELPDYVVRLELSDAERPAYGVTVSSYTFTRNPYVVLYLRKFADGSKLSEEKLLLTLVHELFHVIQRGYKSPYTANYKFDEASAQAVEWEAYDYFSEKGTVTNSLEDCLDNLEPLKYFAIPLDKLKVSAYPEGELKLGNSDSADRSYPIAHFLRYLAKQHGSTDGKYWGKILQRYADAGAGPDFTTILTSGFLISEKTLSQDYLDFANSYQTKFYKYARANPGDNPGYMPITVLKPNARTPVSLVNRDYVIRTRMVRITPTGEFTESAVVLKKRDGFDEVMSDFRVIPAGLEKGKEWKEWPGGIFLEPKTIKKINSSPLYGALVEADGGTAEKTEGWFSDTPAGYDLYMLTAPENPKVDITGTTVRVEPMKVRSKEAAEVVDGIVFTFKLGKNVLHQEQVLYEGWDKAWTFDMSG